MFFGRAHGPVRMVLSIVAVAVLGLLSFVVYNINVRLDNQERANQQTLAASRDIVDVNDRVTKRLAQLVAVVDDAERAVDETEALSPLLEELRKAIAPAAAMVSSSAVGAEASNTQLATIQGVLNAVRDKVVPLVSSTEAFGDQGEQLVGVLRGLVSDLEAAVAAAGKINRSLPLPG